MPIYLLLIEEAQKGEGESTPAVIGSAVIDPRMNIKAVKPSFGRRPRKIMGKAKKVAEDVKTEVVVAAVAAVAQAETTTVVVTQTRNMGSDLGLRSK